MIPRRAFLGGVLAAPALVRPESLMKLWVPKRDLTIITCDYGMDGWTEVNPLYIKILEDFQRDLARIIGVPKRMLC